MSLTPPPLTLLPKHSPALGPLDFAQAARRARDPDAHLQALWRDRLPGKRVFGMPAGRHALWAFLDAAKIPHEGEVIVAGYNYYVIVRLLVQWGLRPVFVDIDLATLSLDAAEVAKAVNTSTRLVLVTHMFGAPADIDAILAICRPLGIKVFEDCAHAAGSRDRHGQLGARGDGALFSFGPQKLVNCFGGGMLALDESLAEGWTPPPPPKVSWAVAASTPAKALLSACMVPSVYRWTLRPLITLGRFLAARGLPWLRDLASPSKDLAGYRFDPASRPPFAPFMPFLCERQLGRLDDNIAARRAVVARIKAATAHLGSYEFLDEDRFGRANGSYFGVLVDDSEGFTRAMLEAGVEVEPHEFYDCASLPQFAAFAATCPRARLASDHLVRLPSYPQLTGRRLDRIIRAMERYAWRAHPVVTETAPC
ncbi:DegT/DnrJ/EryC1/StrS family aminotransferase [Caulobacter sp. RL271]|jgi:dTDP-4-amino-4,6-dideoxygalactose transaminase|uniref:DegT/DnrJ/EryC1/StrS family aminotransferase n=1 Tax=Caulobacter segnis TaxID=88688 RepID=A0ABY4ZP36_9CAUL|nr:DegT/DnrJ/EryC1/StrS family aminotransferase [Caulobacter segnis]USQ94568.1 DegT/DnrJ/EryC1/StrS family aminotransferase [Caulobacter segnis]